MQFFNSKIDEVEVNNQKYFVKRDDLLNSDFSGNKARKFHYFLNEDLTEYKKNYLLMVAYNQMPCILLAF